MERSYIMVKPDGVQRGLVGEIISRFEKKGYYLRALKMAEPTREISWKSIMPIPAQRPFFPALINYMLSGPVICMVWKVLVLSLPADSCWEPPIPLPPTPEPSEEISPSLLEETSVMVLTLLRMPRRKLTFGSVLTLSNGNITLMTGSTNDL